MLRLETGLMKEMKHIQDKHGEEMALREKLILESRRANEEIQKHNDVMVSQVRSKVNNIF
jgi:hypothetical protein